MFLAGGGLGCFIAWWGLESLAALAVAGGYVPERLVVSLDGRVLAFSLLVTIVTGAAFGLAPAWQGSRVDLNNGLKDSSLLFGVTALDVPTHLGVFAVLGMVARLASYLPARRAAAVDPIVALRE